MHCMQRMVSSERKGLYATFTISGAPKRQPRCQRFPLEIDSRNGDGISRSERIKFCDSMTGFSDIEIFVFTYGKRFHKIYSIMYT